MIDDAVSSLSFQLLARMMHRKGAKGDGSPIVESLNCLLVMLQEIFDTVEEAVMLGGCERDCAIWAR